MIAAKYLFSLRLCLAAVTVALCTVGTQAQVPAGFDLSNYGVRIEPDKRLMVVLATLEMANASDATDGKMLKPQLSAAGMKFREQLEKDNADLPADLRRKITAFVAQYKKQRPNASDAELIAPFISMSFSLSPVPQLSDPFITSDLPGTLLDVLDFAPLVREFYRRSTISSKLDTYAKTYKEDADSLLRPSAKEMVSGVLEYLHTRPRLTFTEKVKVESKTKKGVSQIESREHERRFFIVPEDLVPNGSVTFLNVRDDYYAVVSPETDLSTSEARRAFLQFVIDPLVLSNHKDIAVLSAWTKQALDERRKQEPRISPDVFLAVSRSIVAAADIRQAEFDQVRAATNQARQKIQTMKTDAERRAVSAELERFKRVLADESALRLYEEYQRGAVLAFYFNEQLKGIEDSGFDIASSLKDMILAFTPATEAERITATAEARKRAADERAARKANPESRSVVAENPVTSRLLEIQKTIAAKDYTKAKADLNQLLAQNPAEPRVFYNLGRVASLEAAAVNDEDAEADKLREAKIAYTKVLATPTNDRALLSLTYVALARIYEFFNDTEYAAGLYDKAIQLTEVPGGAYKEALQAKQRLVKQK